MLEFLLENDFDLSIDLGPSCIIRILPATIAAIGVQKDRPPLSRIGGKRQSFFSSVLIF